MRNPGATAKKSNRIGVLFGGAGPARDISRRSGRTIAATLQQAGHEVRLLELGHASDPAEQLRKSGIDVAFLALEGRIAEEGCIQGLLELLQIPYTGSGVLESALALDKLKAKELFRLHNLSTPAYYVYSGDVSEERVLETHGSFGYPAIVKPRREGGSTAVARVDDERTLVSAIEEAGRHDDDVLVERFIRGREITVGLLHGRVLGALEIAPSSALFDSNAKRNSHLAEFHQPARLSATLQRNVLCLAERAASALGVTSAVRVDLLVTENQNEYVLEVNTQPSLLPGSPYARIAEAAGFGLLDLCESLLDQARLNIKLPQPRQHAASVLPLAKAEDRNGLRAVAG
jgi:D-alanine-D-alanine ligase